MTITDHFREPAVLVATVAAVLVTVLVGVLVAVLVGVLVAHGTAAA